MPAKDFGTAVTKRLEHSQPERKKHDSNKNETKEINAL